MAAIRPESNNTHSLGTTTYKWSAVHATDVQTSTITTSGNVEIGGNLTVLGESVQIDVSSLAVEDPLISLARNNAADLVDVGFYGKYVEGGTPKFAGLYRDASDGKFKFFKDLTVEPSTTVGAGGTLATLVCDIEGTIEGTAALAAALETARTISVSGDATGSTSFDGSANADIALTIAAGAVENSMLVNSAIGFTDGTNTESIALGGLIAFVGTANEVSVAYDAASNTFTFSLPATINADVNGNASTASALETSRTLSVSGDATGSASFDGSANADIALTIAAGAVENSMLANSSITAGDGVSSSAISLGGSFVVQGTADEVSVAYAAGTFTVGLPATISADVSGNASSASALATARTLSVSGDATGSASFDGSANADIALTIAAGAVENSMLANSGITVGDGTSSESIELGGSLSFVGTANEVSVSYNAGSDTFTFGLPATINADVSGNATSADEADKLSTARTISVSGDATGSASFDGSANADIALTIAAGAVENSMLANSSITVGDGSNSEAIALGDSITIAGTNNEIEVAYNTGSNTFLIGLPDTASVNITGNAGTATALATARTLSVSGDATGSASFDGSANADIALTIAAGAVENSMLANSSISFSDGTATDSTSLGQSISFVGTANEVSVSLDAGTSTFTFSLPATISADLSGNASSATSAAALTTARTLSVSGDATGSTSFDGSANADIALTIAAGAVENSMLANSGITVGDGSSSESISLGGSLSFVGTSNEVSVSYSAASDTFTFGLPATISADLSGNASTASALATSRTLSVSGDATGSASFDGSANADIALTIAAGAVENSMLANSSISFSDGTATDITALGQSISFVGTANEVSVNLDAGTSTFTFSLPATVNADISGNASTASALATSRTLSVSGDATGSASFDGSANADIALTIAAGAVENSMLANSSITFGDGTASEGVALGSSLSFVGTSNEVEVSYDAASNTFTFGLPATINADTTGSVATATSAAALTTARTISVSGDATGSTSFDGSANADIALTIAAGAVENSMLANSSISFSDGTATDITALGQSISFVGTANEVSVNLDAGTSTFTFSLPATLNADISGSAASATSAAALTTARTLSVSGDATGSASFDGSANADIALTIAAGAVENSMLANSSISFSDGTATDITSLGQSISFVGTANEVSVNLDAGTSTFTFSLPATLNADISGSAGSASTAAALSTSRTISVSGDATGSASFDGSANADIALTIAAGAVDNSMLANSGITIAAGTNGSGSSNALDLGETLTLNGTANEINVSVSSNAFTVGLPDDITVQGALTVGGSASCENLTVSGSILSATSATTVRFGDPLLHIGYGNSAVVDHGFFSTHSDAEYVGCAFDESAAKFIMFKTPTLPTTTVNTGAAGFDYADLRVAALTSSSIVNGTLTLPSTNGSNGQYLKSNGDGTTAWSAVKVKSELDVVSTAAQTITITAGSEPKYTVIFTFTGGNSSGTVNLPSASSAGEGYIVNVHNKTDAGTNTITVNRADSDTLFLNNASQSATSTTVNNADDFVSLMSDGVSKWYVVHI